MPAAVATRTPEQRETVERKKRRTAIEFAIWQAEHIGWPALAASFKRDLAEFEAGRLVKWGTT